MMKTAIFGDVGGQYLAFSRSLIKLGCDPETGDMPEDLRIIQLGDLVHKGPGTDAVVSMVDRFIQNPCSQWTQLWGNHESMHVLSRTRFAPCNCSEETKHTLKTWEQYGTAQIATIATGHHPTLHNSFPTLVTHAGLTSGALSRALMRIPLTPEPDLGDILDILNSGEAFVREPGQILTGSRFPNLYAGPYWAIDTAEVIPSWRNLMMPFNQVHGHTSAFTFSLRNKWFFATPLEMRKGIKVDIPNERTVYTQESGATIVGIDPTYEATFSLDTTQKYLLLEN